MRAARNINLALAVAVALIASSVASSAQEQTDTSDKTGTNPINFQRDLRLFNEYTWLNTEGDGAQNQATLEFRTPFADGKWQWRARARYNSIEADLDDDGDDDIDEIGIGDFDMRFLTVPYLKGKNAFAAAFEVFLDTATEDALGAGTTAFGPQAFFVRFFQPGTLTPGGGLFAPGFQYKFDVDKEAGRDDTEQFLMDLNLLVMAKDKQSWFFTDPQIVIDFENKRRVLRM